VRNTVTRSAPLGISVKRLWPYGVVLFVFGLLPALVAYPGDWERFWAGGATVGTSALLDTNQHVAFQGAHGTSLGPWTYPPAFAWAFLPAAHLPMPAGYMLNFVLTLCFVGLSGWILAGVFGFQRWFGMIAALAWEPAMYAADIGQTSGVWLLLISIAVAAAARRSAPLLGGAVGFLLLKPTIALPFVALLLVRREWKACGIVALCSIIWYLASVAATGGEWAWISHYAATVRSLYATDLGALHNGITLPTVLIRLGIPAVAALATAAIVLLAFLPALSRANFVQAVSFTSLLAIAVSPHAWMYDVALILPALFYAMKWTREPWRTRLIVAAYLLAAIWMPVELLAKFNPLALVTLCGAALSAAELYAERPVHMRISPHPQPKT
jgi:Glycosyltransferase family 87